ncbi:Elongation factor G-like protein [Clostridiaceae bacterium JG1575]|nr:Elongation factor G-like protein [Clostridiaceae bacterium JG1575]
MKADYTIEKLRNVGIIGHSGSGKTTLTESLLNFSGATDRMGRVEDGNTISDFDPEEKKRQISLQASVAPVFYNGYKINLVDLPGYFDFVGETMQGMRAVDIAMIVLSATSGIEVGTEKAWKYTEKIKLPRAFYINKMDRENANFDKVLAALKDRFGMPVVAVQYPIGKEADFSGVINVVSGRARIWDETTKTLNEGEVPSEYTERMEELRENLMESVAQTNEELLEKYLGGEKLTQEEVYDALIKGCVSGDIAPVMCGSATTQIGMTTLLEDIIEAFPSPEYAIAQKARDLSNDEEIFVNLTHEKPFSAIVFKTIADPFVGKISLFRTITGEAKGEMNVYNPNREKNEKVANFFFLKGKNQTPAERIIAGDIGAVAKLAVTKTGDTLCDPAFKVQYDAINFPEPVMSLTVMPKAKGDEDKISSSLTRLMEEDPTFRVERDPESAEVIMSGQGETHLEVLASRLKTKFGAEVELTEPMIPYRETIKGKSDVQGKHKKQSGGHGQYGDVKIRFERRPDDENEMEFVDEVVGGAVPRNYIPAVEKGLRENLREGVLAGYPVIKLRATLYDGSFHPVDSSEMAFKVAASLAYKKGLEEAQPILLEPIMKLEVSVPDEFMGDIIGDINKKRGRVLGMEPGDGMQMVVAEIPMAEIQRYSSDLKSMTQARGEFRTEFVRYEEVPAGEVSKIVEKAKKMREAKEK